MSQGDSQPFKISQKSQKTWICLPSLRCLVSIQSLLLSLKEKEWVIKQWQITGRQALQYWPNSKRPAGQLVVDCNQGRAISSSGRRSSVTTDTETTADKHAFENRQAGDDRRSFCSLPSLSDGLNVPLQQQFRQGSALRVETMGDTCSPADCFSPFPLALVDKPRG